MSKIVTNELIKASQEAGSNMKTIVASVVLIEAINSFKKLNETLTRALEKTNINNKDMITDTEEE